MSELIKIRKDEAEAWMNECERVWKHRKHRDLLEKLIKKRTGLFYFIERGDYGEWWQLYEKKIKPPCKCGGA